MKKLKECELILQGDIVLDILPHTVFLHVSVSVGWDVFSVEPLVLIFDGSSDSLLTQDVVVSV